MNNNQLTENGLNPRNPENFTFYIGGKEVLAMPMTRGQYNAYRQWPMPELENPNDEGYFVEYLDGGKPNHPDHDNYISWSPKDVFENNYHKDGEFTFADAAQLIMKGKRVCRAGWNGKNMFIERRQADTKPIEVNGVVSTFKHNDYWTIVNLNDKSISTWVPSSTDLQWTDWAIFKETV